MKDRSLPKYLILIAFFAFGFTSYSEAQLCTQFIEERILVAMDNVRPASYDFDGNLIHLPKPNTTKETTFEADVDMIKISYKVTLAEKDLRYIRIFIDGQRTGTGWKRIRPEGRRNGMNASRFCIIEGVKGKNVTVEITMDAPTRQHTPFSELHVELTFEEVLTSQLKNQEAVDGLLLGLQQRTFKTIGSCTQKTRIILRRRGGRAQGTISVYRKQGNGWTDDPVATHLLTAQDKKKVFMIATSKDLKIVVRNISVGNTLKYRVNAWAFE